MRDGATVRVMIGRLPAGSRSEEGAAAAEEETAAGKGTTEEEEGDEGADDIE